MKLKIFAAAAAATFGLATAAAAAPISYTVNGTFSRLDSTGTYSGNFTYDATTDMLTNVSITTTLGFAEDGVTLLPGNVYDTISFVQDDLFILTANPPADRDPALVVAFAPDLADPNPATFRVEETVCGIANCTGTDAQLDNSRQGNGALAATSVPVAVPTMTEWALIMFGAILAVGAAMLAQRRRVFA